MPTVTASPAASARTRRLTPIERAAAGIPIPGAIEYSRRSRRGAVALTPTPYWADQVRARRTAFPPPADHTPMIRCESGDLRCGRFYPHYYGAGCNCEDCRNNLRLKQQRDLEAWENGVITNQSAVSPDEPVAADDDSRARRCEVVITQLKAIGLTDREIAVLSRSREGHSQREVAALCDISQAWVSINLASALSKITKAGLKLKDMEKPDAPRMISTDPSVIDELQPVAGVARYPTR